MHCPVCGHGLGLATPHDPKQKVKCPARGCGVELKASEEGWLTHSLQLEKNYSILVLPFGMKDDYASTVHKLTRSKRWKQRTFLADNPQDAERTGYFLPYIRRFLFPSLYNEASDTTSAHFEFDLAGNLSATGLEIFGELAQQDKDNVKFSEYAEISRTTLRLFPFGVGFLLIRVEMSQDETFFGQMAAVSHLRLLEPLFLGHTLPQIRMGEETFTTPQLVRYFLDEFARKPARPASPGSAAAGASWPIKLIYDDRMLTYTFSCIDANAAAEDGRQVERWLYRETPFKIDTERLDPNNTNRRAWIFKRWEAYSKDGAALIAFDSSDFHRDYLGLYFGTYYFDIFLLACLQRITLLLQFETLSDIPSLTGKGGHSRKRIQEIQRDLLHFKNQCWFSQITNREKGLDVWRRWQGVFETEKLLQEVNEQSNELNTFLQNRSRERVEWMIRAGAFLAATVPLLLALDESFTDAPWVHQVKTWGLVALITGVGIFGLIRTVKQGKS
ncbi:MAG: hypothetical protein AAF585_22130 [Verrucomicrobiota bacterium]